MDFGPNRIFFEGKQQTDTRGEFYSVFFFSFSTNCSMEWQGAIKNCYALCQEIATAALYLAPDAEFMHIREYVDITSERCVFTGKAKKKKQTP